jgi:hypothetical protein
VHVFELGVALAGGGAQISGLRAGLLATEREELLWEAPGAACLAVSGQVLNKAFQCRLLPLIQRVNLGRPRQFMSPTVSFLASVMK